MRRTTCRLAALVVVGALLGACTHTPGISNGSVSVCFRAIPVGRTAVHDKKAELIGVHRIPVDQVRSHLPPTAQSELASDNDTAVCAMAFRGRFSQGQVDLAPTDQAGRYALILVSSKRLHLIASLVLDRLPPAFGGRMV